MRIPSQRRAPAIPVQRQPIDDTPISVTMLLRREGRRVPHSADRKLQPRAHRLRPPEPSNSWADSVTMRRAGAAAGALVAAASVLGAAVLTDATGGGNRSAPILAAPQISDGNAVPSVGTLPGLGLLGPVGTVPGSDVSVGGPVSLATFATPGPETGVARVPVSSFLRPAVPAVGGGAPGSRLSSGPDGSGSTPAGPGSPGPVQSVADGLGNTVQSTGSSLGGTVDTVTKPLTGLVGGLLGGGGNGSSEERREPARKADKGGGGSENDSDGDRDSSNDSGSNDSGSDGGSSNDGGGLLGSLSKTASGLLN